MTPDLFWIPGPWNGKLAIANRPRGGDWLEDEARGLRREGVDQLLSALEPEEAVQLGLSDEAAAMHRNGLEFLTFPIADRGVPGIQPALALAANLIGELESGKNIAIHCRQGIGRSGLLACAVLVASGTPPDRAIAVVSRARGLTIPETSGQRAWVLQLPVGAPLSL